jgi:hypothetical protein
MGRLIIRALWPSLTTSAWWAIITKSTAGENLLLKGEREEWGPRIWDKGSSYVSTHKLIEGCRIAQFCSCSMHGACWSDKINIEVSEEKLTR